MLITLVCETCGGSFDREKGEHTRNLKKNRRVYCGRSCQGKALIANIPEDMRSDYDISQHAGNQLDDLSPFRYHMNAVRRRAKESPHKNFDIDAEFLKELWETQKGICPYTGWTLVNRKSLNDNGKKQPNHASLDRIDSSQGYVKGNVQFIAYIANIAKNTFSIEQLVEFCQAVTEHNNEEPSVGVAR